MPTAAVRVRVRLSLSARGKWMRRGGGKFGRGHVRGVGPTVAHSQRCEGRFGHVRWVIGLEHEHPHCRKCALCSAHKVASPLYPLCRQNTHRAATAILICIQLYMLVTWRAEGTLRLLGDVG